LISPLLMFMFQIPHNRYTLLSIFNIFYHTIENNLCLFSRLKVTHFVYPILDVLKRDIRTYPTDGVISNELSESFRSTLFSFSP